MVYMLWNLEKKNVSFNIQIQTWGVSPCIRGAGEYLSGGIGGVIYSSFFE